MTLTDEEDAVETSSSDAEAAADFLCSDLLRGFRGGMGEVMPGPTLLLLLLLRDDAMELERLLLFDALLVEAALSPGAVVVGLIMDLDL